MSGSSVDWTSSSTSTCSQPARRRTRRTVSPWRLRNSSLMYSADFVRIAQYHLNALIADTSKTRDNHGSCHNSPGARRETTSTLDPSRGRCHPERGRGEPHRWRARHPATRAWSRRERLRGTPAGRGTTNWSKPRGSTETRVSCRCSQLHPVANDRTVPGTGTYNHGR